MSELYPEFQRIELVDPADPVLNEAATAVLLNEIDSSRLQNVIDSMIEIASGLADENRRVAGLAAPQVGVSERIIIIDHALPDQPPDFQVYINPEIESPSEATNENYEGCFSTDRICGIVERANEVKIKAIDRHGNGLKIEIFNPKLARVIQHEVDHLNGTRFPDLIRDDEKLLWVEHDDFPEFRHTWAAWPHKCSRERWEAMKAGTPPRS